MLEVGGGGGENKAGSQRRLGFSGRQVIKENDGYREGVINVKEVPSTGRG